MASSHSYRKPYRIKRKKLVLLSRSLWLAVLAAITVGGILYFLLFSGFFQIKNIEVTGQNIISKADIESVVSGGNILLTDVSQIQKNILNGFPVVAQAKIRRILPSTLNIKITERLAAAVWCQEQCFLIDHGGAMFDRAPAETSLIKISGKKELLDERMINLILQFGVQLKEESGIDAVSALIVSGERLNFQTSEGWWVYFNINGDMNWQIQELGIVLEKQIPSERRNQLEYVDLRFSRVYYKYK